MTRGELKSAVLDALNRQDLSAVADLWIMSTTTRINTLLRHRAMLKHKILEINSRTFLAPVDFIEAENVRLNRSPSGNIAQGSAAGALAYAPPAEITGAAAMASTACQLPQFYTMHGLQFELAPWRGPGPYQMDLWYYGKLTLGPTPDATNFFLNDYPHVYLNGVMTFGHRFLLEPDAALGYEALFGAEIQAINDSEAQAKIGSGPLIVPPRGQAIGRRRFR